GGAVVGPGIATPLYGRARRDGLRRSGAPAWADGAGRLPSRASSGPGRGRRLPSRLLGVGPESAQDALAGIGRQLALRRRLPPGPQGQGASRPATAESGEQRAEAAAGSWLLALRSP